MEILRKSWKRLQSWRRKREARNRNQEAALQAAEQLRLHVGLTLAQLRERQNDSWLSSWRDREKRELQSGSFTFPELHQWTDEQKRRG